MAVIDLMLGVVRAVVFVYDVLTYPVYTFIQQPWEAKTRQNLGVVHQTERNAEAIAFRRDKGASEIYQEIIVRNGVDTVSKAFNYSVKKFGQKECLGIREVHGIEDEVQQNGKVFQKLSLGDYQWLSYNEVQTQAHAFGRGLRDLGLKPGSKISMFAETRAEWMIACLGAFSQNIHICTVYTNLGNDAVIHALNETEVTVVVTSHELLPKFSMILPSCPKLSHVIYMEDPVQTTPTDKFKPGVQILPFRGLVSVGRDKVESIPTEEPTPDDTAIIMYTSGSTGTPKGVVLTHRNLVATMSCLMFMLNPKDDIYIAYLPLAHVLELLSENTMMLFGIRVGYSSPNTMTDMSTKIRKGTKGDASVLQPTMMCAVPLILDRIYKNILDSVSKRGPSFQKVFNFCYEYKRYWMKRGRGTPICDKIVFNKIRSLLGGKMDFVLVGGAPLCEKTHDFIRTCLGVTVVQGYSLTESGCTGTVMESRDLSTGTVGRPMTGLEVKLINWEEGNYNVSDTPRPRGEICLSGTPVAKGYFKVDSNTKDSFFVDNQGKRWFKTGDVGEFDSQGQLRIIDRKKDLVKLQLGEYVSLGKVEAQLKTHPLVENICVYGDPYKQTTVALVVPSKVHLEALGQRLGKTESFEQLCTDSDVLEAVLKDLSTTGLSQGLEKFEIPSALTLCPDPWTPESGLITAAFKLKRKVVQRQFQDRINQMYSQKRPSSP
ncbi:fatty acid CoA ligase Acsl3-like [Tigriopus californicus]|uniref:fatty acid CoA ligase Acsl3-like n=1 Tax=Tigriopus californicus TaxID=6832 RepID=UPI0027DAB15D|nr:fatty acid CoA ligase Acsl3-like [Tigriopus californicus]